MERRIRLSRSIGHSQERGFAGLALWKPCLLAPLIALLGFLLLRVSGMHAADPFGGQPLPPSAGTECTGVTCDALSPLHDATHSELHTRSEFCATCHNVTHPFSRRPVERTFDEWRDSPYGVAGVTCQDCHLSPGAESVHFGSADMAERVRTMLRSAATIEFVEPPAELAAGAALSVRVRVTNVGAGHKLPTGFPEGREVWVDFKVQDADGKTLYESGATEGGHAAKGTHSYKTVMGDAQGKVVDLEVWKAERILADTRILPKGSALEEYCFTPPLGTHGPLTLVAELEYASFAHELLAELGSGGIRSEVVAMGTARHTLALRAQPASVAGNAHAAEIGDR